jgi:type III restriction enzyme
MFEEEYKKLAKSPAYNTLFAQIDPNQDVEELHNGYFSIDKKGGWTDTAENNQSNRDNAERAYNLIMKEKEKLLSFDTKLKFIFSHSALREGWDNPNVFQICTLRDMGTERERRQTIGRGLRLCVDQSGQRLRGHEVNTLTVIATESYEDFAKNLQSEIEQDTGIKFGIVEPHQFAAIMVQSEDGEAKPLGATASEKLWEHLKAAELIDAKGRVQDSLRTALKAGTLALPEEFATQAGEINAILKKLAGRLDIKNADDRKVIKTREAILQSPEFKALWDRIKHKTSYRVEFDNAKLIEDCAENIRNSEPITKTRARFRKAGLEIGKGGRRTVPRAPTPPSTKTTSSCQTSSLSSKTRPSSRGAASSISCSRATASRTSSATRSSSSTRPPRPSTAPSASPWWMASNIAASVTMPTIARSCSNRRS